MTEKGPPLGHGGNVQASPASPPWKDCLDGTPRQFVGCIHAPIGRAAGKISPPTPGKTNRGVPPLPRFFPALRPYFPCAAMGRAMLRIHAPIGRAAGKISPPTSVKPSPTARALGFYLRSAPSVPMRLPPRYAMNWDGRPARWTGAAPALAASCKTPSGGSWAPAVQSRPRPAS